MNSKRIQREEEQYKRSILKGMDYDGTKLQRQSVMYISKFKTPCFKIYCQGQFFATSKTFENGVDMQTIFQVIQEWTS